MEPDEWDESRASNRKGYARRFGAEPPEHPMVAQETDEDIKYRFNTVRSALDGIRDNFKSANLDVLIIFGDDQNELFTEQTYIPALAIYTGEKFRTLDRANPNGGTWYNTHHELAEHIYVGTVDDGFDVVGIHTMPDGILRSHATGPILERVDPGSNIKIVPVWIEGIHMPAPSPARCYAFGQSIARAIESWPGNERIGVIASGGLSHFTAGYPYKHAPGVIYGDIAREYDLNTVIETLKRGEGESFASLTNRDLLDNGLIELRSWIAVAAMVGAVKTKDIVYEPFFRGIMGMGVAYWDIEGAKKLARAQ